MILGGVLGNPQNMLIGSVLRLPFDAYVFRAWLPVGLSLLVALSNLVSNVPAVMLLLQHLKGLEGYIT
jgi:Na+/H+ antiporter NhaD/arsenite permease-like protein